jgi:histidyl-tRNA synthetase
MKGRRVAFICDNVSKLGLASATLDLDVIARGLNYYTGAIFDKVLLKGSNGIHWWW